MAEAVNSRETRDFARELKFLLDERQAPALREWARERLAPDAFGWQQLWVEWVGLQAFSMHLADYPDHVTRTIELLARRERQQFEIAYRSPATFISIPDNITAPAIGPKRFREYCIPMYNELGGMLAERGARLFIHMDGLLKPLWKDIAASRVGGLDSFTPVPDCDTTVAEALAQWPDKVLQLNFPSSVHLQSPQQVRAVAGATGNRRAYRVAANSNLGKCAA